MKSTTQLQQKKLQNTSIDSDQSKNNFTQTAKLTNFSFETEKAKPITVKP